MNKRRNLIEAKKHLAVVLKKTDEPHCSAQRSLTLICEHVTRLSQAVGWLLEQEAARNLQSYKGER